MEHPDIKNAMRFGYPDRSYLDYEREQELLDQEEMEEEEMNKEKIMKMVSDAIDAGFRVEVSHHEATDENIDDLLKVFDGLYYDVVHLEDIGRDVYRVNCETAFKDGFEANIFKG